MNIDIIAQNVFLPQILHVMNYFLNIFCRENERLTIDNMSLYCLLLLILCSVYEFK